jgi:signal transduction histidine kinase
MPNLEDLTSQSSGPFWAWLSAQHLDESWGPEMCRPEYLSLERRLSFDKDFLLLGEIAEVVSTPADGTEKWYVDARGARRRVMQDRKNEQRSSLVTHLPQRAILVTRGWASAPNVHYWNQGIFRGDGAASEIFWVLQSHSEESIAWLQRELTREDGLLQLRRATAGSLMPHLTREALLNIRVRRLSVEERELANHVVLDSTREHVSSLRSRNVRRPFILTGQTFEERINQFERYLEVEGLFVRNDAFFVEPATGSRGSNLFAVRPILSAESFDPAVNLLKPQDDPEVKAKWRAWFWDASDLETHRVFNSLSSRDELPAHLLVRTVAKRPPAVLDNLRSMYLLPQFGAFRDAVLPNLQAGEGVEEQVWCDIWSRIQEVAVPTATDKDLSATAVKRNGFSSFESEQSIFDWARAVYRPALVLKVRRVGAIVGAYLLFGDDQLDDYAAVYSKLDDIGIVLADVLLAPSELIEEATRRESLRRLSWVMHQLNGPVGRANNALEDVQEFLGRRPEIGEFLVPSEEKAKRRSRMPGSAGLERQTLAARLQDAMKAVADVRKIAYQVRRLKRVQGDLPKTVFGLGELLRRQSSYCPDRVPELDLQINGSDDLRVFGNQESIGEAIEEVLNNACRELCEHDLPIPVIQVKWWAADNDGWFSISDNALPVDQRLIVEPFEEDASTYSRSGRGSGLGLAIVRETLRAHGGNCSLSENIDENGRLPGVTFTAHFPIQLKFASKE